MTLYLSQLTLNPEHGQARRDLASPYQLHRTLSRAFGDAPEGVHRQTHGVLFRVDDPAPGGTPVLVQSATDPDWRRLPSGYALRRDGPKPFELDLALGQTLRFRLAVNPVRRINEDGKRHPTRLPLVHPRGAVGGEGVPPDGYLDWLARQGARLGFDVLQVSDVPFRVARRRRRGQDLAKAEVPHFGVRFDGTMAVTDPEALTRAVHDGVGPAKAFGFGLLSLATA